MTTRRVAEATPTTYAKAPGRIASRERISPVEGEMTFRDAVLAGGLRGLTMKETFH